MLALSSPGVRVARAEDGAATSSGLSQSGAPSSGKAEVCKVREQNSPRAVPPGVSAQIAERIRAEMLNSGEAPVVLNGRGYNYDRARDPQLELRIVEAEAARQQEQAPADR
jgi:hypothetical protein